MTIARAIKPRILGENTLVNGDFEQGLTGWTVPDSDTTAIVLDDPSPRGKTKACNLSISDNSTADIIQSSVMVTGKKYNVSGYAKRVSGDKQPYVFNGSRVLDLVYTKFGEWVYFNVDFVAQSNIIRFRRESGDPAGSVTFADLSVQEIISEGEQYNGPTVIKNGNIVYKNGEQHSEPVVKIQNWMLWSQDTSWPNWVKTGGHVENNNAFVPDTSSSTFHRVYQYVYSDGIPGSPGATGWLSFKFKKGQSEHNELYVVAASDNSHIVGIHYYFDLEEAKIYTSVNYIFKNLQVEKIGDEYTLRVFVQFTDGSVGFNWVGFYAAYYDGINSDINYPGDGVTPAFYVRNVSLVVDDYDSGVNSVYFKTRESRLL